MKHTLIECRKIYWDDLDLARFLDLRIERHYPRKTYHRIYFGQIVAIWGERSYKA